MDSSDALRAYLSSARALLDLEQAVVASHEPMQRMQLLERRRRAAEERRGLEGGFVAAAAAWAASERVTRAAFLAEGVPAELLDRAGVLA